MPVTHEEISALAYKLWQERGEPGGSSAVDWERAEAMLQLKAINLVHTALSSDLSNSDFDRKPSLDLDNRQTPQTDAVNEYAAPLQALQPNPSRNAKRRTAASKSLR